MRVALPTNDGVSISPHFGRSAGFLVFEIEDGRIMSRELRENAMQHSHGAGEGAQHAGEHQSHGHAGLIAPLAGCDVVLCAGMGWRAAEALKAAGIADIRFVAPGPAEDTVAAFLAGKLPPANGQFCQCSH